MSSSVHPLAADLWTPLATAATAQAPSSAQAPSRAQAAAVPTRQGDDPSAMRSLLPETTPGDRVLLSAFGHGGASLRDAAQRATTRESVGSAVSNIAKGHAADNTLPQHYDLKSVAPDPTKNKTTNAMIRDERAGNIDKLTERPRGEPVVRTDAPHRGSPSHHINIDRVPRGIKDPHVPISPTVYHATGVAARLAEGADKVAAPVAIAVDVGRIANAYAADGGIPGLQLAKTAGSIAGGWAGAFAGAASGAVAGEWIGGSVGLLFGGVGAAPGAAVGGVVGGAAGGIAGAIGMSVLSEHVVDAQWSK